MTGSGWRAAREKAGLTLRGLADLAGVSPPFLSDVEHGRRGFSPGTEAKVRAALGLGPAPAAPSPHCVVCESPLTTDEWSEPIGEPVFGPGGHYVTRRRIRCPRCGLLYAHEPRPDAAGGTGTGGERP